jgi:polar amino acid transport system substrate-binding protein
MARRFALLIPLILLAVACAAPANTSRPSAGGSASAVTSRPATAGASTAPSIASSLGPTTGATSVPSTAASPSALPTNTGPSPAPSVMPASEVCGPIDSMPLKNPGRLTLSTDNPAFPPWFEGDAHDQFPLEPEGGSAWSDQEFSGEPYSKMGFESATAYAIAEAMGFTDEQVDWMPNAVFEAAFAPGDKPFDFHMAQIAITPQRAQAVTFSDPYFDSNQAVLALDDNDITGATSIEELKAFRLGAATNTTSLSFLEGTIAPTVEPSVFNDNKDARQALKSGTVDGIVVDLLTAFFMRDVQVSNSTIVGQFGPPAEPDHVGFVLQLGSPFVDCVNAAIAEIKADGTHQAILDEWITSGQDIPFLQ